MTISPIGVSTATAQTQATGSAKGAADPAAFERIFEAFKKEAAKTPAERARDEVLKKNNLTEDSYRALSLAQKKAIDAEIAAAVQRVMHAGKGKGFRGAENAAAVMPGTSGETATATI